MSDDCTKPVWTYRIKEDLRIVERVREGEEKRASYIDFYWLEDGWKRFKRDLRGDGQIDLLTLYSIARDELIERGLIQDK